MISMARWGLHWLVFPALLLALNQGMVEQPAYNQTGEIIYVPQAGTPTSITNFIAPELGCNWSGIGGQLFDLSGKPVPGIVVKIDGSLGGAPVNLFGVSGGEQKLGPAGFALKVANRPIASNGTLFIQFLDITGKTLTPRISIQTYADCERNFVLINIKESLRQNPTFFPMIRK